MKDEILPGTRVYAYNFQLKKYMPGIVKCRYGFISKYMEELYGRDAAKYPDCCDILFDHTSYVSRAHFTSYLKVI